MHRRLALPILVLVWAWLPGPSAAAAPWVTDVPVMLPSFTATMPDRFGLDGDADGAVDLPNTADYVRPGDGDGRVRFTLRLDASASRATLAGHSLPITGSRWRVSGPDGILFAGSSPGPVVGLQFPEGTYRVALDIRAELGWGSATARAERQVVVEDLLIVAVGDSYASGDGNPERPRTDDGADALWADSPDATVAAAHAAAHRSTVSWPALAALALERADPTTSVTFVSLAATGARVGPGLLAGPRGEGSGQLAQAGELVGEREIDLLLVSIGGNDVGFAQIVRGLVDADPQGDPVCYRVDVENVWRSAADGNWGRGSALGWGLPWVVTCRATQGGDGLSLPGLEGLPGELDALAAGIDARLDVRRVYLMEYPDPTGAREQGELCREIAGDLTPPFGFHEIDEQEQAAAREGVLAPLNRLLAEAAGRHGWSFVGGIAEAFFAGHGYCAGLPEYEQSTDGLPPAPAAFYRHPMWEDLAEVLALPGVSWYRTAVESAVLQGPDTRWETTGTLHPNELGQLAMASALLEAVGSG